MLVLGSAVDGRTDGWMDGRMGGWVDWGCGVYGIVWWCGMDGRYV